MSKRRRGGKEGRRSGSSRRRVRSGRARSRRKRPAGVKGRTIFRRRDARGRFSKRGGKRERARVRRDRRGRFSARVSFHLRASRKPPLKEWSGFMRRFVEPVAEGLGTGERRMVYAVVEITTPKIYPDVAGVPVIVKKIGVYRAETAADDIDEALVRAVVNTAGKIKGYRHGRTLGLVWAKRGLPT